MFRAPHVHTGRREVCRDAPAAGSCLERSQHPGCRPTSGGSGLRRPVGQRPHRSACRAVAAWAGPAPTGSHAVWMYDPLQTAGAAAAVTERIGIGVQVVPAYYPPVYLANVLASLDSLSEGRVKIAVGVGWVPGEFAVLGSDFATRGRRTDEIISILRACWEQRVAEFHGQFYDIAPLRILPPPAHRIPILIAGTRRPAFERAVRLGDGYHGQPTRRDVPVGGPMTSNSDLPRIIAELRRQRPDKQTFTMSLYTHDWDPAETEGEVIRRERDYYREIGVQHVVIAPSRRSADEWLRSVEQLAGILDLEEPDDQ